MTRRNHDEAEMMRRKRSEPPPMPIGLFAPSVPVSTSELASDAQDTPQGRQRNVAIRMRLLRLIASREQGYTADELNAFTGISGDTIRPRLGELLADGLIERSESITRPTRSGREAACWFATTKGRAALAEAA